MADSSPVAFVRDVAAVARERQISVKSAGVAYHAFNTLVPLVILLLVGVTIVDSLEPLLEAVESATGLEGAVTDGGVDEVAGGAVDRTRAALLALVVLLWSAARLFQAVNSAFTDVYGARRDVSYANVAAAVTVVTALDVVLVTTTVAVGVALVGAVGVSISIHLAGVGVWAVVLATAALAVLLTAVFLPMYYLFPQPDVSIREVLPGTIFAALAWTALAVGFRIYVSTSESVALFGIAGAVLLVLTWVYLGALCLLLGAVLNAVLADRVDPDEEWVPMREVWSKYA
ncbi:YhjD/YihY/BrkB family envelope integrity protein [Natrarchaeobius oligotrophus]|uniref:YihY/virulence factor BrkB family protein n=1 Tax=Natrarchaeobius chitinivorans TaxID=1679083 RepID=A0A3N6MNI9_NATCH|nr:YhjD/YihY/BrkB family envelope integrity protein [Natrarchaeobius chitinivorans]RQG99070.1 YihY/virulence factor BrkB family protein [Natrarchaeobius chitinivorans]